MTRHLKRYRWRSLLTTARPEAGTHERNTACRLEFRPKYRAKTRSFVRWESKTRRVSFTRERSHWLANKFGIIERKANRDRFITVSREYVFPLPPLHLPERPCAGLLFAATFPLAKTLITASRGFSRGTCRPNVHYGEDYIAQNEFAGLRRLRGRKPLLYDGTCMLIII